jgi:hypothetical protein
MPVFGFVGPAYTSQNPSSDPEDLVNLYPEMIESGNGPSKAVYYNRPGLTKLANLGANGRALWGGNNALYAVVGGNLVQVDQTGAILKTYTIANASGPAQIVFIPSGPGLTVATSGALLVWDGSPGFSGGATVPNVWYVDGTTLTPPAVISGAGLGCIDGYGVVLRPGCSATAGAADPLPIDTQDQTQFNLSNIFLAGPGQWDPLQFAIKTGAPDALQAIYTPGSNAGPGPEELWLFGKRSIEVWYNTGGTSLDPFPFQRVPGAFISKGCWAAASVVAISGTLFWLGGDDRGVGVVYKANGYIPQRVSTHAVEYAIQQYVLAGLDISDAIAYGYQENGHDFYVLNFPTANRTWVYDATSNLWHRRANNGTLNGQLGYYHAWEFGAHYLLDSSGNLYTSSISTYQDDGAAIGFQRTTPIICSEDELIKHIQLELHFGGPYNVSSRTFQVEVSNDGGQTFGAPISITVGTGGSSPDRAIWRRLGMGRKRVYRITTTDNQAQNWVDGYAHYQIGSQVFPDTQGASGA